MDRRKIEAKKQNEKILKKSKGRYKGSDKSWKESSKFNKIGYYVLRNAVVRSRNVYSSTAILKARHHFTRTEGFYGDLV
jgi:hypothetical protein